MRERPKTIGDARSSARCRGYGKTYADTNKAIGPIIKRTGKALSVPQEIKPLKEKMKRAKPLKYDTDEKAWARQIDEILTGKKKKSEVGK